ncbi:MAG: sulfatase-like hydrolase/transferase [Sphingomicrobium sp.]
MKPLAIAGIVLALVIISGAVAWTLWPVQVMVVAYRLTHRIAATRLVTWQQGPATTPAGKLPPNIILIVGDDLAINDVTAEGFGTGFAGGLVPTPNIDAIAHEGADFLVAYAANATCSPSRAALMTGRYPQRFGFEFTAVPDQLAKYVPRYAPNVGPYPIIYHADLEGQVPSMAEMGMPSSEITIAELLRARGYHTIHLGKWHLGEARGMRPEDQGFDESLGFMAGASKYAPDTAVDAPLNGEPLDRLLWLAGTDAVQFNGSKPFHAGSYMTDYLSDQAVAAIKANRNRPFFIYLAYNAPHTPFQATKADYDALSALKGRRARVYGAMLRALDRGVGKVTSALKADGLYSNTIVIFTSDNGGASYAGLPEINKPFRGRKGTFFEGGIREPFFIRWPSRITAAQHLTMPAMLFDVLPTLLAAAGAQPPRDRTIDGINLLPFVAGHEPPLRSRVLFWRSGGYEAVRDGNWKLQISPRPSRIWLFNLASDPTERSDVSGARPDIVAHLRAELSAHDRQMARPSWPALLEEPIRIDAPAGTPWRPGQEYVYWPN